MNKKCPERGAPHHGHRQPAPKTKGPFYWKTLFKMPLRWQFCFSDLLSREMHSLPLRTAHRRCPRAGREARGSAAALTGTVSMMGPPLPKIIYRNSQNVYGPPWKPNGAAHFCLQTMLIKGSISPENEVFLCNAPESTRRFSFSRMHNILDKTGK